MAVARYATTLFAVVAVAAGCATSAIPNRGSAEMSGASAGSVVTAQELARMVGTSSLMDALKQTHPSMLLPSRGATPMVSLDGSPATELSLLQTIPTSTVREVRRERSSSSVGRAAIASNGDVIVGDIIVVTTWKGGRGSL